MAHYEDPTTQQANARYIRSAMDEPMLERGHELDLARRWREQNDESALHELIRSYTRLVVAIAAKFKNYGLPLGDLIQEGNIGLMEAASRFKPELENRFSTYATWWVRAQIQDYVLRNWSIVRAGTTAAQKTLFFNLRRLRAKLDGQSARDYLDAEATASIARQLEVTPKEVTEMESRMNGGDKSLNARVGENGETEWQDFFASSSPTPEDAVMARKDNAVRTRWLTEALDALTPRERTIIVKRQLREKVSTFEVLGKELGVSKERVRQLELRALDRLKTLLQDKLAKTGTERDFLFHS